MNELQFIQYKHELRLKEQSSGKLLWVATYSCFIYMLFGSFNITGKMLITQTYLLVSSEFNEDFNYSTITLANFQYFFYQIVGPLSLPILPYLIGKLKFRFILLIASFGPELFMLPALYFGECGRNHSGGCNVWLINSLAIVASLIAGLFQSVLLFAMLYYLSNLSKGEEKVIFYGAFFFIHNFQWLLGSLIGNLLITYVVRSHPNEVISTVYIILLSCQVAISLLYLTLPEEDEECRISRFRKQIQGLLSAETNIPNNSKEALRQMLLNSGSNDDDEEDEDEEMITNSKLQEETQNKLALMKSQQHAFQKSNSIMTLQCFSIEEQGLIDLMKKHSSDIISIEEYQQNTYLGNIYLTWTRIQQDGFLQLAVLIFLVSLLEAFLLLYFFVFYAFPDTSIPFSRQSSLVYDGYFYVGIGELFGCFGMGVYGDFKDKMRGLFFQLGIFQFGCILAWSSYYFEYEVLVSVFACIIGFCDSALTSTIISFQVYQFSKLIYMIDLMFGIYSVSFAVAALIFIGCNYSSTYLSLLIMQLAGLMAIYSAWQIKSNQRIRLHLSK